MAQTLLVVGLACIVAAIVGGGLTAFQVQMPALTSRVRQVMLAALGLVLIGASFFLGRPSGVEAPQRAAAPPTSAAPPAATPSTAAAPAPSTAPAAPPPAAAQN